MKLYAKAMGGEPRVGETIWRGYVCTMSNLSNIELVKLLPQAINGLYQVVESVVQRLWVENTEQVKLYAEAIGGVC